MAGYSTSNPPALIGQTLTGKKLWLYSSADADSTVNGASYFSDGIALGMGVGDIVLVVDTATPLASFCFVTSVSSTAATTSFGAVA